MNQEQSIALFLEGREAWNKWANDLLAKKAELKKAGKWKVKEGVYNERRYRSMSADPSIPEIQNWLDEAYVDFSNLTFQTEKNSHKQAILGQENSRKKLESTKIIKCEWDEIDFSFFIFPDGVDFTGVVFEGDLTFSSVVFKGNALFNNSIFYNDAVFELAKFKKEAHFMMSAFYGNASFILSAFEGYVNFSSAVLLGNISFISSSFKSAAFFPWAEFHDNANFKQVTFEKQADFANSKFKKNTNFEAILVKQAFTLANAKFTSEVPNFTQANFAESPRLDNVEVLPSPQYQSSTLNVTGPLRWQRFLWKQKFLFYLFRMLLRAMLNLVLYPFSRIRHAFRLTKFTLLKFINHRKDPNEEAHYRALKRLAVQAHDHVNEMKFFAGEIGSRRHLSDKLLSPVGFLRYLFGVLYELTSNFGRSFFRPVLCWFIAFFIFSQCYISGTGLERTAKCANSNNLSVSQAAYTIGLKNSFLIMGLSKTDTVKSAQACLYGANALVQKSGEAAGKQQNPRLKTNYQGLSKSNKTTTTEIPFWKTVYGILHSILSLTFIFLFLLALRNQFKIK